MNYEDEIGNLLESLSEENGETITSQVKTLIAKLCCVNSCPLPEEVQQLEIPEFPQDEINLLESESDSDNDDVEFMAEDDIEMETKAQENIEKLAVDTGADLSSDHKKILKQWTQQQMQNNLNVRTKDKK